MEYNNKKFFLFFLFFSVQIFVVSSQENYKIWSKKSISEKSSVLKVDRSSVPNEYSVYDLDINTLKNTLKSAPKRNGKLNTSNIVLSFPNGDGEFEKYEIFEAPIMEEGLQKIYPNIRSYIGKGVGNSNATIRFSITASGLNAMTFQNSKETTFIDPYTKNKESYLVYKKTALPAPEEAFICKFDDFNSKANLTTTNLSLKDDNADDGVLRTFRLAVATTGEYSQFHLNYQGIDVLETDEVKKAAVLSAIVTTMTRVNGIFERDVALNMVLVANNKDIIFLDGDLDSFTNDDAEKLIDESQNVIDATIGTENYDIGHTFSTGGGGLAQLNSPCTQNGKARGITGSGNPVGDAYDIDYVAHEMGHQYGAHHTFNGEAGNCGGNRSSATAVEPGSGSTIMAYSGLCAPQNVESLSDDYFHYVSIKEMWANLTIGNSTCAAVTNINNDAPVIESIQNYTVPISTPFALSVIATDVNGDGLTYTWEQLDSESTTYPLVSTATGGPAFRSVKPTTSSKRYFPSMETVLLGNTENEWEVLPSVSRTMRFGVTVRDNNKKGGQTASAESVITFSDTAGAFKITSQTTPEEWHAGTAQTITWDVSNTNAAPINCSKVNILFSTDGGKTYPHVLASNVSNNGLFNVVAPNLTVKNGRVKIESVGNIFFNTNVANISILASEFIMNFEEFNLETCAPNEVVYNMTYNTYLEFNEETTFSATGIPEGSTVTFTPGTAIEDNTSVQMKVTGIDNNDAGSYSISVNGTSVSTLKNTAVSLNVFSSQINAPALSLPENESTGLIEPYNLSWVSDENILNYDIEIATDETFTTIIESNNLNINNYTPQLVQFNSTYYWRVKGRNDCGESEYSTIFNYTTANVICDSKTAEDTPIDIPDNSFSGAISVINIVDNKSISDVNVTVNVPHEWVGDITLRLISPLGTNVLLSANNGGEGLNYTNTIFDNDAELAISSGVAPFTGVFRPQGDLSILIGEESYGEWILKAIDGGPEDLGSIESWSIEICGVEIISDDNDKDGVLNDVDICPNTPLGSTVDANGCAIFSLPTDNFTIEAIGETCPNKNNGQILISAEVDLPYEVTINGNNANLVNNDLNPGTYTVCISVPEENYEQCFVVTIEEGVTISGKANVTSGKASIDIEQGTAPFTVLVNSEIALETFSPSFVIDNIKHGDLIQVKTNVSCEGIFSKPVSLFDEIVSYPNPTRGSFEIALPVNQNKVKIELYNIQSQLISIKEYDVVYGKVQLNLNNNASGLYFAKVYLDKPVLLKIIKE